MKYYIIHNDFGEFGCVAATNDDVVMGDNATEISKKEYDRLRDPATFAGFMPEPEGL